MTWPTGRLSQLAEAWPSNVDKHSVEGESRVRLCNYTDVYKNDAITESLDFMVATASEDQIDRFSLKVGDTIITKDSETADDIGIPAFVSYEAPDLICGYHLAIVRPIEAASSRYVYWALRSDFVLRQWSVLASGVTRVALRRNDVSRVTVPIPPVKDQQRIADYLDREAAQIDTLIAKQEQLIATLRERRASTVSTAFDTDQSSHLTRLKYVATVQTGVTLAGERDAQLPTWPYLRVANVQAGHVNLDEVKTIRLSRADAVKAMLQAGDVLMTEGGDIDKLGRGAIWSGAVPDMLHQNHVFAVRPEHSLSPHFLAYYLESAHARTYFELTAKKTTNLASTNKWTLGNLPIPRLATTEQTAVVTRLDTLTTSIDTLIAKAERFIELSKERRAALITAAVTGQLDIPTQASAHS